MMSSLEQRESAYETEFAHREELKFQIRERAVKSLALWAAGLLGKTDNAAYATEVVAFDIANPRPAAMIARIVADLAPVGIGQAEVDRMMNRFLAEAEAATRTGS
jgi:hypothetical protein